MNCIVRKTIVIFFLSITSLLGAQSNPLARGILNGLKDTLSQQRGNPNRSQTEQQLLSIMSREVEKKFNQNPNENPSKTDVAIPQDAVGNESGQPQTQNNPVIFETIIGEAGGNLRSYPSTDGAILQNIPKGTQVQILGYIPDFVTIRNVTNRWFKVLAWGKIGWIFGSVLSQNCFGATVNTSKNRNTDNPTEGASKSNQEGVASPGDFASRNKNTTDNSETVGKPGNDIDIVSEKTEETEPVQEKAAEERHRQEELARQEEKKRQEKAEEEKRKQEELTRQEDEKRKQEEERQKKTEEEKQRKEEIARQEEKKRQEKAEEEKQKQEELTRQEDEKRKQEAFARQEAKRKEKAEEERNIEEAKIQQQAKLTPEEESKTFVRKWLENITATLSETEPEFEKTQELDSAIAHENHRKAKQLLAEALSEGDPWAYFAQAKLCKAGLMTGSYQDLLHQSAEGGSTMGILTLIELYSPNGMNDPTECLFWAAIYGSLGENGEKEGEKFLEKSFYLANQCKNGLLHLSEQKIKKILERFGKMVVTIRQQRAARGLK